MCRVSGPAIHVLGCAEQRPIAITAEDAARVEKVIDRLRPAFERPDQHRYWITVRRQGGRIRVIYDIRRRCLMSVARP